MEREILREMHERIVKGFMDVLILAQLRNGPMSGMMLSRLFIENFICWLVQAPFTPSYILSRGTDWSRAGGSREKGFTR